MRNPHLPHAIAIAEMFNPILKVISVPVDGGMGMTFPKGCAARELELHGLTHAEEAAHGFLRLECQQADRTKVLEEIHP